MDRTTYGLDIAKSVMQLHWVDAQTGEIGRKKLARAKLAEHFAQLQPVRVVMEACGSAHHWARVLGGLGHEVELLPARQVRPFVRSNKDDAADARARDLAGGAAWRHPARADQELRATGGAGAASHAPALGERAHGHRERPTRAALRVRRRAAWRTPGRAQGSDRAACEH